MRCTRCNTTLDNLVEGWNNCPKCNLPKFVTGSVTKEKTDVPETPEADVPEEKKNQDNEPDRQD